MTNDADNPDRIEREIERDRAALNRTLHDLQGELSLDGFTRRVTDQLRDHGGEWANSISHAARANPVALAVTGVGLAWLIFGRGYDPTHRAHGGSYGSRGGDDWRRPGTPSSVRSSGGPLYSSGRVGAGHVGSAYGGSAYGATDDSASSWRGSSTTTRHDHDHDHDRGHDGDHESVTEKLGHKARDLGHRISDAGSSMSEGLRRKAHDWRDNISDKSGGFYNRLSAGTEDLGDEARRRVADARYRALEARDAASRRLRDSGRAVSDSYDSEPLVFGAAAFAVGAGLACLLPRTRQEDELMGSYSDQLFAEAEAIFHEEKSKVQDALSAGLNEAKSAASDVAAAAREELSDNGSDGDSRKDEPGDRTPQGGPAGTTGSI